LVALSVVPVIVNELAAVVVFIQTLPKPVNVVAVNVGEAAPDVLPVPR
jgi:hypothetical protein